MGRVLFSSHNGHSLNTQEMLAYQDQNGKLHGFQVNAVDFLSGAQAKFFVQSLRDMADFVEKDMNLEADKQTENPCPDAGKATETQNTVFDVKKELPSCENGYVDSLVLVWVKNKNEEDGIYLPDMASFDGESWIGRIHTWEDIVLWQPLPESPVN